MNRGSAEMDGWSRSGTSNRSWKGASSRETRGGRPLRGQRRLILAATLSPLYGIYSGYVLCENRAVPGTQEYRDSEKYEIKVRDWGAPENPRDYIARVNATEGPARPIISAVRASRSSVNAEV